MRSDPVFFCSLSLFLFISGLPESIGDVGTGPHQFLADNFTLFQSGGGGNHAHLNPNRLVPRAVASGGGALDPQFMTKQLTLSQPGGRLCPPQYYEPPPRFLTLRRPCNKICYIPALLYLAKNFQLS